MKKLQRLFAILLCLSMVLGMAPMIRSAAAEATHAAHGSHEGWTPVSGELTADKLSGNVVLNGPASIASTVTIEANKTVHLCLNGQTVTVANGVQALVINGSLELCDCAGGGKIAGNVSTAFTGEGLVDVNGGATFTMHGGTISGGYGTGRAGGVCVSGTFLMDGGEITGCKGKNGGAIFSEGTTTITGSAKIHGNTSTDSSGAIRVNGGTTTISGGEIYENTTNGTGGMTWVNGGTLNITGGTIRKNSAADAGAIYVKAGATLSMSDGLITGNSAKTYGFPNGNCGGVKTEGTFTMTGGELSDNSSQSLRGDAGTVTISGSSVINHVKPNGATFSLKNFTEDASVYATAAIDHDDTVAAEKGLRYHYTYKASGSQEPITPGDGEPLRILAIGNELSREYMYYLGQLGLLTGTNIQAAYLSAENASLRDHAYNMAAGSIAYSYYKTDLQTGKLIACEDTSVAAALLDEEWDVILLQHSINAVGWPTTYNSDLEYLIDYFHGEEPNAKVYWTMTWALEDGFSGSSGHGFDFGFRYDNSQKLMYNAIVDSMDQYIVGAESRFGSELEGYVPVGAAIQNLRAVRGDTLSRDGYLLSLVAGRLTAALTLLETLAPNADLSKITASALTGILEEQDLDGQEVLASAADAYVNNEASLKQVKDAVAAACEVASEGELPETFVVNSVKENQNADTIVVQMTAPWSPRTPNLVKLSDGTIIMGYNTFVDHAITTGLGNMQEGSMVNRVISGKENPDGTITWNFDEPLLVIDEDYLESKGIVTVSDRYARIEEDPSIASSVTVATGMGDTTVEVAWIDMDDDGDKEEVLLCTYWGYICYQNGSHEKAGYLIYSLNGGQDWSDPYCVTTSNGPLLKFGSSAIFEDGQILMPYYGQYIGAVLIEWSVEQQNWVQLADYEIPNTSPNETTEFNEVDLETPDGGDTVYAMVRASGAVLKSEDRGKTWVQIGNEPGLCGQPNIITLDDEHLFFVWVNQDDSPRDTYGKLFNVNGDWTDYPTVKIYASPDRSAHDTGNPGAVQLSDGRILVMSYDINYRCIVGNYVDPWSEAFQPREVNSSVEEFELSKLESGTLTLGEHMLEEAIPGSHTINAKVQFTSANGNVTIHTPNGTLIISAQAYNLAADVSTNIVVSVVGADAYVKVWQTAEPEEYTIESLTALAADAQAKSGISGQDAKLEAFDVSKRIIVELQASLTGVPQISDAQLDYSINPVQTNVSWRSSNEEVATVSDTGVVHFVAPGTADIILTVCGKEFVCKVTVNERPLELTGNGLTTVFVNDDFSGYGTGDDAFWNTYWAAPASSEYWVNIAKDAKDPGLKYNIKEENGNKYLEIHSMGAASWLMNKDEITGDYTVQYDFRFHTLHDNSPSDRFNTMMWQTLDENGKTSNAIALLVNLRQEGFQFYNDTVSPAAKDNHYGLYERGVWTTVKIVRTSGIVCVKMWPQGTEEPEAWDGILFDDVIDTSIPSHYCMQFAPKSGLEGKFDMDNLMISQQVEDPSAATVKFDSDGGSEVAAQIVKIGDKLTVPTAPTKEGYTFIGWYYGMSAWNFETDTVQASMTLTAKWEENVPATGLGNCAGHSHAEATALTQADIDAQIAAKGKVELANKAFYLTEAIEASKTIYLVGSAHLCLNGHTITFTTAGNNVNVQPNTTASICDCDGDGSIVRATGVTGTATLVSVGGTLTMYGGTISGNTLAGNGAGVKVENGGTFEMRGGIISNNTCTTNNGAGVFVNTTGSFTMYGGWIMNNSAPTGGGVHLHGTTTNFTMNGGYILNNTATGNGGAINSNGTVIINNGTISGNSAVNGGAIYNAAGTVTFNDGTISGNSAAVGGAIYAKNSCSIYGGLITGNSAVNNGAGQAGAICSDKMLNMYGGVISGNSTDYRYSAIKVNGGSFNMYGGVITDNNDSPNDLYGSVAVGSNTTFNIEGASVIDDLGVWQHLSGTVNVRNLQAGATILFRETGAADSSDTTATVPDTFPGAYTYNTNGIQARILLGSSLNMEFMIPAELGDVYYDNEKLERDENNIVAVYRNPAQMAEAITLTIGDVTYTDSVQNYAMRWLRSTDAASTSELKALLIDMLNYGAAVQSAYPGYTTATTLPNANLNESSTTVVPEYETKERGNASLILSDSIALRVGVTAAENTPATYTFTSWDGEEYTVNTQVLKEGNTMYVLADKIAVADAFEMVTVKVGTETVSDSVAAYCDRQNGDLYDALLKFAAAAQAYLAA